MRKDAEKKAHPGVFFAICIILLAVGIFQFINYKRVIITDVSGGVGKVIYEYVENNHGLATAKRIRIRDTKNFSEELGHEFAIYRYSAYTGNDRELVFFFLRKDDNDNWYIESVKSESEFYEEQNEGDL